MVGKHRLHAQGLGHLGHGVARAHAVAWRWVAHHQARTGVTREGAQVAVQNDQGFPNELDPPVGAWQAVQDVAVEDKQAVHLGARAQRMEQRSVIFGPQIAPKPHQAGMKLLILNLR